MVITGRKRSKCVERWTLTTRCVLDPKQSHVGLWCIKWHLNSFPAVYFVHFAVSIISPISIHIFHSSITDVM